MSAIFQWRRAVLTALYRDTALHTKTDLEGGPLLCTLKKMVALDRARRNMNFPSRFCFSQTCLKGIEHTRRKWWLGFGQISRGDFCYRHVAAWCFCSFSVRVVEKISSETRPEGVCYDPITRVMRVRSAHHFSAGCESSLFRQPGVFCWLLEGGLPVSTSCMNASRNSSVGTVFLVPFVRWLVYVHRRYCWAELTLRLLWLFSCDTRPK